MTSISHVGNTTTVGTAESTIEKELNSVSFSNKTMSTQQSRYANSTVSSLLFAMTKRKRHMPVVRKKTRCRKTDEMTDKR